MASITQKIPNYVLGMSTQPDERKIPGQLVDLKNGVPDVVRQLIKRPGSHLVKDITTQSDPYGDSKTYAVDTGSHCPWFNIYTSDATQYIGQVTNSGKINIWRCSDGAPIPVDYSLVAGTNVATYLDNSSLSDEKSSDIQALTINETTFFVNRRKDTALLTDAKDKAHPQLYEAYVEIKTLAYGRQYSLDFFDPDSNTTYETTRVTSVSVQENLTKTTGLTNANNGSCEGMGREIFNSSTGTDKFSTVPPNMSASGKSRIRFEIDARCQPVVDPSNLGEDGDGPQYNDSYQCFGKLQFGGEGWQANDTVAWTNEKGLSGTLVIKTTSPIRCRANRGAIRPNATSSSAEEHISANLIVSELKSKIDSVQADATDDNRIFCEIVGSGIHLWSHDAFGVSTSEKALMSVITTSANTIDNLPTNCRHGYTVRVANSNEDVDDYYLRFNVENLDPDLVKVGTYTRSSSTISIHSAGHGLANGDTVIFQPLTGGTNSRRVSIGSVTTNTFTFTDYGGSGTVSTSDCFIHPLRFGEGVWEEVCARGLETTLDKDTMPLKLTRVDAGTYAINGGSSRSYTAGTFQLGYPDWGERDAGDDVTNSAPSFVGHPIQNMVFFRNRICLLSEENVILSRVNQFYNFWVKTAMAISNTDPIDLQSSSTFPTRLHSAIEATGGLVVFSASEQFLVSSGQEALFTPETVKVTYLSSYAFNPDTNPVSLGTSIGFLNSTAKNARFYEMADVSNRAEPQVMEQSKIIGEVFPTNTTLITGSTENDILLFGVNSTLHSSTNEVWGYKWYEQGNKRAQSAWFRWTLSNKLVHHTIMDDQYFTILHNATNDKFTLERFDIKLSDSTFMINLPEDDSELELNDSRIHLDTKSKITSSNITWNSGSANSTFTLGAGYYSNNTLTTYCPTVGLSMGKSYDIPINKISGTAPSQTITLPGNWKFHQLDFEGTDCLASSKTLEFDDSQVNISNETITIYQHGLSTLDRVILESGSASVIGGLGNTLVYFVIRVDDDNLKLATTTSNASAGTAINLTSTGGAGQYFKVLDGITLESHGLETGSVLVARNTSGTITTGITAGTTYYAIKIDNDTIQLASSAANATAGTNLLLGGTSSQTLAANQDTHVSHFEAVTDLIVGYEYEFQARLPKLYVTRPEGDKMRSETRGSLVIHRMNFDFGDVGVIDVTLKRRGRDDYTYTVESLEWDNILASSATIADSYTHTIPVYDRNTNLDVYIKSNHPSPATLHSMNWEGDYSTRYYQRV